MINGYLEVHVYSGTVANPVSGAVVTILKNNEELFTTTTNEDGKTELFALPTVDKKYSLEEQYQTRSYETYDVLVTAIGLNDTKIEGVQIFENITSYQDIYLTSIDDGKKMVTEEIPPNNLWENQEEEMKTIEGSGIAPIVLKAVVIPQNIVVHDGAPNDTNVPNYTVSFVDYIKNVASSEIYSTWSRETIKANVLAIISFTLNRIYTEWYRSRGYDFTITSTTSYDQKYTRNGTIFKSISDIVEEIFTNYIRKGIRMEPLLAQYKDETTSPNTLSQWGSKELGDKGYDALQILRYYYGEDINIYEAEVIDNYPYSFSTTLKKGDCSLDVYILQNSLNYIHGSYPGIPLISSPSGDFDDETTTSVRAFQKVFSLPETGQVDFATWYKISYILTATQNLTNSVYS